MIEEKEYIGIAVLEYGNLNSGFLYSDLNIHLKNLGYEPDSESNKILLSILINKNFHPLGNSHYSINNEGYFQLLDYYELKEARQSSKDAKKDALHAIYISIAGLFLSAVLSIISIFIAIQSNNITSGQTISNQEKADNRYNDSLSLKQNADLIELNKLQLSKMDSLIKVNGEILNRTSKKK